MMRTLGRVAFLIPLLFATSASIARADSLSVGDHIWFEDAGGGFTAYVNGNPDNTFLTFCLQARTPMEFETEYIVSGLSEFATLDQPSFGGDASGRDFLSSQTAWLYSQLRNNTLDGHDGSNSANSAFQWAVWVLEDEFQIDQDFPALASHFIDLANQAVQNGFSGIGNVRAINLTSLTGEDMQDQLALVTTPEPPTVALLVCGLLGLGMTRRRWLAAATTR
jgi:hypothetical protein